MTPDAPAPGAISTGATAPDASAPSATATGRAVAVLLAAGAGTRLGRGPKALLPHRGRTLVEHLTGVLAAGGCDDVVVVLGADAPRVAATTDLGRARVVVNEHWATGMASSLRVGVAAALDDHDDHDGNDGHDVPRVTRVVVAHVDQPGVAPDDVARLLGAHRPGRVTVSRWADAPVPDAARPGWSHPLVLDATLASPAAASAAGDVGARAYLRAHADLIDVVVHPGDGRDVDTAADLDLLA
ncbi:NTP transferase domain-containing protein [Isoptericola sp. NPDC057191]|uniref:nucleotidyltransferase family protein n=1 Tax=Isoptericola sp. NPDC057191 TaxID=3346041 RepID=UPI00363B3590